VKINTGPTGKRTGTRNTLKQQDYYVIKRYGDPSVRLSVCLSVSTLAACSLAMCGLRTRPRTDLNPRRVELPSVGAYRLAASGAIACLIHPVYSAEIVFRNQFLFKRSIDRSKREFTPRKTVQSGASYTRASTDKPHVIRPASKCLFYKSLCSIQSEDYCAYTIIALGDERVVGNVNSACKLHEFCTCPRATSTCPHARSIDTQSLRRLSLNIGNESAPIQLAQCQFRAGAGHFQC